ncbi:hypothetical protein GCM10010250_69530 [Streptomyces althioticus]|nr:hypothetical protein GCM10010250_69530 [Streptomyces althioticus]
MPLSIPGTGVAVWAWAPIQVRPLVMEGGPFAGGVRSSVKQWRGLAVRTDKLAIAYQAALHVAAILICARRR